MKRLHYTDRERAILVVMGEQYRGGESERYRFRRAMDAIDPDFAVSDKVFKGPADRACMFCGWPQDTADMADFDHETSHEILMEDAHFGVFHKFFRGLEILATRRRYSFAYLLDEMIVRMEKVESVDPKELRKEKPDDPDRD